MTSRPHPAEMIVIDDTAVGAKAEIPWCVRLFRQQICGWSGMPGSPDASPFAGAAQYYDRFRAPYAQAAIDFIVERYNLSEGVRALDLGCGPGTIAIPLSHTVAEV